jgi:hypothetical protein
MCGRPLDAHDRHVRFRLPAPVLTSPAQEKAPGSWLSHDSPEASVIMQVPAIGAFVRALLPVRLSGGHTVTFGVWVGINPRELQRVFAIWWEPEYRALRLDGTLANSIPPWGLLAAPVTLTVRDPQQTPYCSESQNPQLSQVLNDQWPHEDILDALP